MKNRSMTYGVSRWGAVFTLLLFLSVPGLQAAEEAAAAAEEPAPAASGEGIAAALYRRDSVTLQDGTVIEGTILMAGVRGIVLAVEEADRTERFLPLKEVKAVKRAVREGDNAASQALVKYYRVTPRDGQLVLEEGDSAALSAEQEAKRRAALPERTARGKALREELAARRKEEHERRRREAAGGSLLARQRKKLSEKEKQEQELLDLFGGEDTSRRRKAPQPEPILPPGEIDEEE